MCKYSLFAGFPSPSDRPSDRPSDDETFSPVSTWVIIGSLAVFIFFAILFGKYVLARLFWDFWYRRHAEHETPAREHKERQIIFLNTSENSPVYPKGRRDPVWSWSRDTRIKFHSLGGNLGEPGNEVGENAEEHDDPSDNAIPNKPTNADLQLPQFRIQKALGETDTTSYQGLSIWLSASQISPGYEVETDIEMQRETDIEMQRVTVV